MIYNLSDECYVISFVQNCVIKQNSIITIYIFIFDEYNFNNAIKKIIYPHYLYHIE